MKVAELVEVEEADFNFEALGENVTKKRITPLQMVLHMLDEKGNVVKVNATPDTGSTHNIMEMSALQRMGLKGTQCRYTVTGHGGHTTTHEAVCAKVTLCSPDGKNKYSTKFFAYENPCGGMMPEDWGRLKRGWPHLKKLDIPTPVQGRPVEVILGCDNLGLFEALRPVSMKGTGDPIAKWTPLGWMVGGRTRPEVESVDDGQNHVHSGTILVGEGQGQAKKEVSYDVLQKEKAGGEKRTDCSDFAGEVNVYQDC